MIQSWWTCTGMCQSDVLDIYNIITLLLLYIFVLYGFVLSEEGGGRGVIPALATKDELTKLLELPESIKVNITLFLTSALILIVSSLALLEIAFMER
ncbi:hypothetical protein SETIT_8G060300v2 [Setaria italica]|uniref:Uncharacterized protein n=2 Tax=Setaria TaxID=4554 RepID=A0A368S4S0_SETIT|nr:hypothetical protein SETIT_8G060300v2 [Setaria italica]TKV99721.1 hypothetical protein SEVIR_8G062200v2 [Setaria viridis]